MTETSKKSPLLISEHQQAIVEGLFVVGTRSAAHEAVIINRLKTLRKCSRHLFDKNTDNQP